MSLGVIAAGVGLFIAGVGAAIGVLALLGRASGKRGPNSRVPTKETIVAVKNRS